MVVFVHIYVNIWSICFREEAFRYIQLTLVMLYKSYLKFKVNHCLYLLPNQAKPGQPIRQPMLGLAEYSRSTDSEFYQLQIWEN